MSGHSNYQSIGSVVNVAVNLPQANNNIINVGENNPVGAANDGVGGGVAGEEPHEVMADDKAEPVKAIIRQLDILLARAAANATKAVDANAMKEILQKLELPEMTRNAIGELADKAEASFKAINTFTGRQIGEAISVDGGRISWAKDSAAAEAMRNAIDAQLDLSGILQKLVNRMPACEIANELAETALQCDRRASEIQTLANEFADVAEKGEDASAEIKARLDMTLEKLLPRKSLEMHGNEDGLAGIKAQVEPLAKRLDDISKNPSTSLSKQDVAAVNREIDTMANALDAAVKRGTVTIDSAPAANNQSRVAISIDRTLFGAAKDVLKAVKERIASAKSEIASASIRNFTDSVFHTPAIRILSPEFRPFLKVVAPLLAEAADKREDICKAAKDYVLKPDRLNLERMKQLGDALAAMESCELAESISDLFTFSVQSKVVNNKTVNERLSAEAITQKFNDALDDFDDATRQACTGPLLDEFVSLLQELREDARKCATENRRSTINMICDLFDPPSGLATQVAHLEMLTKNAKNLKDVKFQTSGTLLAAFEGKIRFTTLVEARLRGIADEDVDPKLDDINIESSTVLGNGKVNTVYEVTCKDGSKYVFKPEEKGRQSLESLYLSMDMEKSQMIAGLNMASQKTADALGLDDIMTKTTVGAHNGSFGIFMEKAPGLVTENWRKANKPGEQPDGMLSPDQIKSLPDDEYAKVVGELMRKANRMEWCDLITGQGDRHPGNYLLAVDSQTHSVSLKGIDNDACFPVYRNGVNTYTIGFSKAFKFQNSLEAVANKLYPNAIKDAPYGRRQAADFAATILDDDPGITRKDDGSITVDLSKVKSPVVVLALAGTIGIQTAALPDHIDEDVYTHLMELCRNGQTRKKYIADISAHLPKPAVDAAIKRLDEAVAHAKNLAAQGKVISKAGWMDHDTQRSIVGEIPLKGKGGFKKIPKAYEHDPDFNEVGERNVAREFNHFTSGYFRRDIARAIAKDGWFNELKG